MSAKLIGYALGAIASYSAAKDLLCARVIFCDARAMTQDIYRRKILQEEWQYKDAAEQNCNR